MAMLVARIVIGVVVITLCTLLLIWGVQAVANGQASSSFMAERWPWLAATLALHGASMLLREE